MRRVLLLATTTGYQTRAFGEAAERLGVELVFATDRCHMIDDPWRDRGDSRSASTTRRRRWPTFSRPPEHVRSTASSSSAIGRRSSARASGRRSDCRGIPPKPPRSRKNKQRTRERLRDAGLAGAVVRADDDRRPTRASSPGRSRIPCVVKPVALSGSRGVMRADDRGRRSSRRSTGCERCCGRRTSAPSAATRTTSCSSKGSSPAASSRSKGCCITARFTCWRSSTSPIRSTGRSSRKRST